MNRSKHHQLGDVLFEEKDRRLIAEELKVFLAETYSLYLLTQNFHWNVNGILFQALHQLFEKQYLEFAEAVDVIAERIRALGFRTPASFREFSELSSVRQESHVPESEEMIRILIEANGIVGQKANRIAAIADEAEDWATTDLMSDRLMAHEKAIWMLKSSLQSKEQIFD